MNKKKLLIAELCFFIFYFLVLQLISDIQYNRELGGRLADTISYRLQTAPLMMAVYFVYYKVQLPLLFRKKYLVFFISLPLFIFFLEGSLLLTDWITSHNHFIPEQIRLTGKYNLEHYKFPRQLIGLTVTNLFTLTGFGYFIKKLEDELKIRKLKEQHLQLELDYLKAQLHPHFFFNTLNNIYSLALYHSDQTAPTVARLSELMRYIIYDGNKKTVPLTREIEFIRNYIHLEQIRHNENTRISFIVQGKDDGIYVEPLLFIPLIENSFKHGINRSMENASMEAVMVIENNEITLEIKNSKPEHKTTGEEGIGLQNIKKRLELLYPGRHELLIKENEDSFEVFLHLQLRGHV
jgi:hypothetical protein